MTRIKEMYGILEQMIESAANGQAEKVFTLHESYKVLSAEVYPTLQEPLRLEYDNCRNSCVVSVGMLKHLHDQLVLDARERFSKIPKP